MTRALGIYKEIRTIDQSHRGPFQVTTGSGARPGDWSETVRALQAEIEGVADRG